MEIQTINLSAAAPQTFLIPGKFLEIIDAPYPFSIQIFDIFGNAMADGGLVNAESGLFVDLRDNGGWGSIQVVSAQAQTVKLLIGSMMGGSRRQPGVVQVVDGSRARVLSGTVYTAAFSIAAAAGQRPKAGLWNPAATGRRAVVKRVYAASSVATDTLILGILTVPLGTLDLTTVNKLTGAGASTNIRRTFESTAGNTGTTVALLNVTGNKTEAFQFDDPWILNPGTGLIVQSVTDASTITVTVEFMEDLI